MSVGVSVILSFAIACLSGMGVGSGGLLVICLVSADYPQLVAQGINLFFFVFSSGSALLYHIGRRKILWGAVLVLSLTGIAGTLLGSFTAQALPSVFVRKIFGVMLVLSAATSIYRQKKA